MIDTNKMLNTGIEKNPAEEAKEPEGKVEFGAELNDLRQRVVKGEDVTRDELSAALITLRDTFGKKVEANAKAKKKAPAKKKKSEPVSAEKAQDLLNNLI